MSRGPYGLVATLKIEGVGIVQIVERGRGYGTLHIRHQGDTSNHYPRITKHDARILREGTLQAADIVRRYLEVRRL